MDHCPIFRFIFWLLLFFRSFCVSHPLDKKAALQNRPPAGIVLLLSHRTGFPVLSGVFSAQDMFHKHPVYGRIDNCIYPGLPLPETDL